MGRSQGYWRHHGSVRVLENDSTTHLDDLRTSDAVRAVPSPDESSLHVSTPGDLAQRALLGGPEAIEALAQLVRLSGQGKEGFIDPRDNPGCAWPRAIRLASRASTAWPINCVTPY